MASVRRGWEKITGIRFNSRVPVVVLPVIEYNRFIHNRCFAYTKSIDRKLMYLRAWVEAELWILKASLAAGQEYWSTYKLFKNKHDMGRKQSI